ERMMRLLEHAGRIGMLPDIAVLEEPFGPASEIDVAGLPVRVSADESVESSEAMRSLRALGYSAFALKPSGRTVSVAFEMLATARELGAACYIADNACVPVLLEWNKNFAARLPVFPGLRCGILESNGPQNYRRWNALL